MFFFVLIFATVSLLYLFGTRNYGYWTKKGIKHDPPIPFFGNNWSVYAMKKNMSQVAEEQYWKYPQEKVVGFYRAMKPELVIRDPEIAKRILTTDFAFFHPRGFSSHKTVVEPLTKNVFAVDGDTWKLLRQRLTPAFTTGKLKAMFPLIVERAECLQNNVIDAPESGKILDARDIMARYTTDFIGACGFGIDIGSLSDEKSAFRQVGIKAFEMEVNQIFKQMLKEMFPETFKNLKVFNKLEKDVFDLVSRIVKQRNNEPSGRNDFIDLLLECRKKGAMVGESIERVKPDGTPEQVSLELDDWLFTAQVFLFFIAGFETSSTATSFTLHQLAFNPDEQKKVQDDIDRVLARYNNKLCYDAIREMTYLDCAFKEAMRIFPSVASLTRKSVRKYTFPELDLSIDEDVMVVIPVQAMQMDPQYFDEPSQFRPERFLSENFSSKSKSVYLPFGLGPRSCIGERLGHMQSVAGLAAVLSRYSVEPTSATLRHPKINPRQNTVQNVEGELPLLFRKRPVISY